jgi:hypothetical protein
MHFEENLSAGVQDQRSPTHVASAHVLGTHTMAMRTRVAYIIHIYVYIYILSSMYGYVCLYTYRYADVMDPESRIHNTGSRSKGPGSSTQTASKGEMVVLEHSLLRLRRLHQVSALPCWFPGADLNTMRDKQFYRIWTDLDLGPGPWHSDFLQNSLICILHSGSCTLGHGS